MKRPIIAIMIVLGAGAVRAEEESDRELHFRAGAGLGVATVSLEVNLEGRRWYSGAQLALAAATRGAGGAAYAGMRAGVFLTDGANTPFIGIGFGGLGESDGDARSSSGLGGSAELGMAFRRDEKWFHPQFVLQGILPFSQRTNSAAFPYQPAPVVLAAFRVFF
jgi:hypothetical protein